MTKVEALLLAEVITDTAHVSIREGRDGGDEGLVVTVGHLGVRFGLGERIMVSPRRKSCFVSLTDVGLG
jgi:hypothetical protein